MAVRVMVADPSVKRRGEFVECVRGTKFEVVREVDDIESVIQLFGETRPDIVVLAITFETIGGIKAIGALRDFDRNVKIVITYDGRDRHLVMDAVRLGAVAALRKPFRPDRVAKALAQALSASDRGAGRQWSARLTARLIVRYKSADAGFFTPMTETAASDISPSGIAITTTEPQREGSLLKLKISLPNVGTIKTLARVKRVEKKKENLFQLGLMFVELPDEKMKQIEGFIMSALSVETGEGDEDNEAS